VRHHPISSVAAALAILAISVMSACGSSSPSNSSSNSPIQVGGLAPLSGKLASFGQGMVTGEQLAIQSINANGGVLGRQLDFHLQDDAGDPADGLAAAQLLIQTDNVVAIMPDGVVSSVVLPLADGANIPIMTMGGGTEFDATTDTRFFRLTPSDTEQSDAMMIYAHSKGWNNVAIAIGNAAPDQALLPGLISAGKTLGMTVAPPVVFAAGSSSFRSEIQTLYASHPQAIMGQFDIPSTAVAFAEIKQQGLLSTPWIGSNLWYASAFFKSVGASVATGPIYIATPGSGTSLGTPPFLALLKAKNGATSPNNGTEGMYDMIVTWALGIDQAGTTSEPKASQGIVNVANANGTGTPCGDYGTCYSLIKAGKPIDWQGSGSVVDFNQFHNVFGPFDFVQYKSDGTSSPIASLSPAQIASALAGH